MTKPKAVLFIFAPLVKKMIGKLAEKGYAVG